MFGLVHASSDLLYSVLFGMAVGSGEVIEVPRGACPFHSFLGALLETLFDRIE